MRYLISAGIIVEKTDDCIKLIFPKYFITKSGHKVKKSRNQLSGNGEPRYVINPNAPDSTYCIKVCVDNNWTPVFKYKIPTAKYRYNEKFAYIRYHNTEWKNKLIINKLKNKHEKIGS